MEEFEKEFDRLKRENQSLKERLKWYEEQSEQMEDLIKQYNDLVRREFDNIESLISKLGTHEVIDPVTRVYSRDHMLSYLNFFHSKAFQEDIKYALIFVDIDDFQSTTGSFDHEDRDLILRDVGKFLKDTVRVPLDTVSKLGADEFLLLLTEISKKDTLSVANRIRELFEKREFKTRERSVKLTCTVSVVHFPEDSTELSKLLENGEKFIEIGKRKGKNTVISS